jgi:hypothetical protein
MNTSSVNIENTYSNSPPTNISLDNFTIEENFVGVHIANIIGSDPDDDTLTYSITEDSDSSSFEIRFNQLFLARGVSADYEIQSSYTVTLLATDIEGLTYSEDFTIYISDKENSRLYGSEGNDTLDGFFGYDTIIEGGNGIDTVKYSVSSDATSFIVNHAGNLVIRDTGYVLGCAANDSVPTEFYDCIPSIASGPHKSDTLFSVERIQFTNNTYALDLDGNAGIAAKVLITSFGVDSLNAYMSVALSVVDEEVSLESLCDLVVANNMIEIKIGSTTNNSFVEHVFENVVGRMPNIVEQAIYTDYLDNGTYTKSSLLALAANTTLTENLVAENSVDLIGVPGSSDGELLAIQYDIGLG